MRPYARENDERRLTLDLEGLFRFQYLDAVVNQLYPKHGEAWQHAPHLENHDIVGIEKTANRESYRRNTVSF